MDARVVGRVVIAICLGGLAVLAAVLFVAGAHKNAQISGLKQHGVPVVDTVSACSGLLGGSGSNAAGYRCWGTFTSTVTATPRTYPGNVLRASGSKIQAIADPTIRGSSPRRACSPPSTLRRAVFILPTVLLVVLVRAHRSAGAQAPVNPLSSRCRASAGPAGWMKATAGCSACSAEAAHRTLPGRSTSNRIGWAASPVATRRSRCSRYARTRYQAAQMMNGIPNPQ